ncbi:TonB-dependent siderophore receptor [Granulicella sp. S190]|uniref:TonB-dependent receptor plug domain-containing protein n=1 Tax=Granulicella sp. S190 TaxID=1747226 RepID=UPI00131D433A|nr:TonB-dependent receptor [Granulicella sp. S190]
MNCTTHTVLLLLGSFASSCPYQLLASNNSSNQPSNSGCPEVVGVKAGTNSITTDAGCRTREVAKSEASAAAEPGSDHRVATELPGKVSPSTDLKTPGVIGVLRTTIKVEGRPTTTDTTEGFERKVSEKEIEESAGTFGDPSRFLQLLPGVVSDNDQYNDFIVRGGNPDETLFLVDNIEVPSINQLALSDTTGGFVSMIDNAAVQKLTLHTDAYDSKYDQRLSSIVEFSTIPEGKTVAHSESELGIAGVGGSRTVPWGDGSLFVSARRSILNLLTNDIGLNGVPIYSNALIRADKRVDDRNNWWGLSLTGIDSINIHPSPTDPFETNPYDIHYQGWRNTTGLNWQHVLSARSFGVLSVSNSQQSQTVLQDAQLLNEAPIYSEESSDGVSTIKYDWTLQAKQWLTVTSGARASVDRLDYRVDQPLGLQNPYSEDPAPLDATSLNRRFTPFSSAVYGQASVLLPHGMKLVGGERVSQWAITGSTIWSPKVLFVAPILGRLVHVGYAEYAQLPPNLYLVSFTNQQTLKPIRSKQYTAGIDVVQSLHIAVSVEAYRKRYMDYPVATNYPQLSLANIADTFGQAFLLFRMTSAGLGLAQGAELSVRYKPTSGFTVTSAVTYARSWYSGLDGVLRRGNYDIPFVANIAGTLALRKRMVLTSRYSQTSGRPYTPDNIALSDAQDRDVYDLSMINAARSAAYHRLDFRLEQSHPLRRGVFTWHVGLENALGSSNFYSYQWRPRAGDLGVLAQDQLPRFPDGGIKFLF